MAPTPTTVRQAARAAVVALLGIFGSRKAWYAICAVGLGLGTLWLAPVVGMEPDKLLAYVGSVYAILVGAHAWTDGKAAEFEK